MEYDPNERRRTSIEDDPNGRQPQWKTTPMEDDLNGMKTQWRTTSMEEDLKEALQEAYDISLSCLVSQLCTELGPAQPQLVLLALKTRTAVETSG